MIDHEANLAAHFADDYPEDYEERAAALLSAADYLRKKVKEDQCLTPVNGKPTRSDGQDGVSE